MSKHESPPGIDDPELLAQALSRHDVSCPSCRYNLRGVESTRCPECGAELGLQIGIGDLRMGAWIVSLVAACFALGFLTPISILTLWLEVNEQAVVTPQPAWWVSWIPWTATGLISMLVIVLVTGRQRYLRTSPVRQRVIAFAIVLIAVCCAAFLFLFFFAG